MATVMIDDALYRRLKASAEAHGSSPDEEAALIIEADLAIKDEIDPEERSRAVSEMIARMRSLRQSAYARHGPLPDTTELLRQMREEE